MRKLILILTFFTLYGQIYTQIITPYDLYLVKESQTVDLVHYFLVNYKNFKYDGIIRKTDEGNDVYRFSNGSNYLEIYYMVYVEDKLIIPMITYFVYTQSEYNYFTKNLSNQNFTIQSEGVPKNNSINQYYWIYTHASSTKMLIINLQSNHHTIQIIV